METNPCGEIPLSGGGGVDALSGFVKKAKESVNIKLVTVGDKLQIRFFLLMGHHALELNLPSTTNALLVPVDPAPYEITHNNSNWKLEDARIIWQVIVAEGIGQPIELGATSKGFSSFTMPVIRAKVPSLIASELVSVQPMSRPVGNIYSLGQKKSKLTNPFSMIE